MTKPVDELIASLVRGDVWVLDGGLATELEARGLSLDDPLWSAKILLKNPAAIEQVHYDYLVAGAEIIITASYQATFAGLAAKGLSRQDSVGVLQRSVEAARRARDRFLAEQQPTRFPLIAASVGPYGATLPGGGEFRGNYGLTEQQLYDFHAARFEVLVESGADLVACETIPAVEEASVYAKLLRQFPAARAWISFTCRDGKHTAQGDLIAECACQLDGEAGILAVGVNCTSPTFVESLIGEIRSATVKPIVVYPNSGELWDPQKRGWIAPPNQSGVCDSAVERFAANATSWQRAGAQLIGGCCRTTPAHIAAVRKALTLG